MSTVAVQKLKFMIAVIFAVFPNTRRYFCWHFCGNWISCKKINASGFLVPATFGAQFVFHLYFGKAYPPCSAFCLRQLTYLNFVSLRLGLPWPNC